MKKYEYFVAYYLSSVPEDVLNELGNQGWELIQVICTNVRKNGPYRWLFKREKIEQVKADITD